MTSSRDVDIQVSHEFATSAEELYTAFTAPLILTRWFGPLGWSVQPDSVVVEPRPYGRYRLTLVSHDDPDLTHTVRARVLELIPGRRVAIEERTAMTQMHLHVDITPTGEDTCRVDLIQGPYAGDCEAMAAIGWESAFTKLDVMFRSGSPSTTIAGPPQPVRNRLSEDPIPPRRETTLSANRATTIQR
ncbi:MAG TPA: SRPBCC domain-containing protein [Miltoncostaeales bacterium]|nr:SRPBCC domain-containing protein [Miltoncostaeales bacterium]